MDKKKDAKDTKEAKDANAAKQQQPKKEEKKEETAEERRVREEKEALRKERKEKKKAHTKLVHDQHAGNVMEDIAKKQAFRKFSYRGEDLTKILNLNMDGIANLLRSRQRRRLKRKMKSNYSHFLSKLLKNKKECPAGEKPAAVKTHLRDCIVLPQMIQSVVNIYNGHAFNSVEIKPEMIGYYLGEFSMTYKKVTHGRAGVGATHSSKFVPIR